MMDYMPWVLVVLLAIGAASLSWEILKGRSYARGRRVRQAELDMFLCDMITAGIEEGVYRGKLSKQEAEKEYKRLAAGADLPDLTPRKLRLTRKDIHKLKKELHTRNKAGNGSTKYKEWEENKGNGKKRSFSIASIRKTA